jgi:hypothetical protein
VAHEGSDVYAVGLDPEDGTIRWRRPLGTSGVVPGIAVHFGVLQDRYVAYFEPLPSGRYARLLILDPRGEGKQVARSATMRFSSYPSPCDDDEQFICGEASEGNGSATYRLRPGMDALEQSGETHGFIQSIGPAGLVRFTDAKTDQHRVGVQHDGKTVWSKPERELFGPHHTTDGGWGFQADAKRHLVYGTVGPVVEVGDAIALKEARLLIGFDSRTGAVRWQHRGLDSFCDADFTRDSRTDPFIVCERRGGTATVGDRCKTTGASVAMRRVDPATGRTLWRTGLGAIELPDGLQPELHLIGPKEFGVETKAGPVVISLANGKIRPGRAADEPWGEETVRYEGIAPWRGPEGISHERHGVVDRLVGGAADGFVLRRPIPDTVGAQVGTLRIVATKNAVLAFPAAQP